MSGGCVAACDAVWMPPAVIPSQYDVLMLLSGRRIHDVHKKRPYIRNHTRDQQYTQQGAQRAVPMGDAGCTRRERRLSSWLVLCGWRPPCSCCCCCCCCTCVLPLLHVTAGCLCCRVHNMSMLCSPQHAFLRLRRAKKQLIIIK